MAFVSKGEVSTFTVELTAMEWSIVREGRFIPHHTQGRVPYRLIYEKLKDNRLRLTIDARETLYETTDVVDPNKSLLEPNFAFEISSEEQCYDCILSIDLGNTRTVALLVDKVNMGDVGALRFYPVPMSWGYRGIEGRSAGDGSGAIESIVSLACSKDQDGAKAADRGCLSFLKMGDFARHNNRLDKLQRHMNDGCYTLSSPKRYFWDGDEASRQWLMAVRASSDGDFTENIDWLGGQIAEGLAISDGVFVDRLPRANLLGGMVVEIYEQAVHYIGSKAFKDLSHDGTRRRISRIHVTYPSTLLPRERDLYVSKLRKGITTYLNQFVDAGDVVLTSEIDEASSVLSVYSFSRIRAFNGASNWLRLVGRKSVLGHQTRLAVVDIGGGTSDLTIAQVEALDAHAAVNPFRAAIDVLYRDGVNNAGDAFVARYIQDCVREIGLKAIKGQRPGKDDYVRKLYHDNEQAALSLTQTFWYPLAIEVMVAFDKLVRDYGAENVPEEAFPVRINFNDKDNVWKKSWDDIFKDGLTEALLEISLGQNEFAQFLKTAEQVFGKDAKQFAKAISAYDVDSLILSGKTSEFAVVQSVFSRYIALPKDAIETMKNFEVGKWCSLADAGGRIADSKVATALGGAMHALRTCNAIGLDFNGGNDSVSCEWGIVTDGHIAFTTSMFPVGSFTQTVPMSGGRVLIARRMNGVRTAILSYEMRVKPSEKKRHPEGLGQDVTVTLERCDSDCSLKITACSGHFADGSEVRVTDVECRVYSMNGDCWLDKIVEV